MTMLNSSAPGVTLRIGSAQFAALDQSTAERFLERLIDDFGSASERAAERDAVRGRYRRVVAEARSWEFVTEYQQAVFVQAATLFGDGFADQLDLPVTKLLRGSAADATERAELMDAECARASADMRVTLAASSR